ncbi:MAG: phosphotransferase [Lachnospiraceae bacterium]|nr:phosphotransferase [Lachnospiraceae bacterium]
MEFELWNQICNQLNLGTIKEPPRPLKGGFLHRVYSLFTAKGRYAVKLLNPYVMQRETAMDNFRRAEELETLLTQHGLPILPALSFRGKKLQEINGQFFYLFDWFEGRSLKREEIKESHCCRIGTLLAQIHEIDKREQHVAHNELHIDWDYYIEQLACSNQDLSALLKRNRSLLYESQERGNAALKTLPPVITICHNDMDCKNVLWNGDDCRIIDLECLAYSNPFLELYEMALCWSGYEDCNIDCQRLKAFIQSYSDAGGELPTDWETLHDGNYGRLEWLEYNVKRSLGRNCSVQEQSIGISEVQNTMALIVYYYKERNHILNCI